MAPANTESIASPTLVGRHASRRPADVISACLEDLRGFAGANPGMDDVTLLAIQHDA